MAKVYTLDNKLLIGSPEVRIGDKIYAIDDREKTVRKVQALSQNENKDMSLFDDVFKLAFGDKFKEISNMNMPFAAYQELFKIVVAAMTGEELEAVDDRFPDGKQQ